LESKVHRYEAIGLQASRDAELQQITRENDYLKRLLHSMGLGDEFLTAYTRASDAIPEISTALLGANDAYQRTTIENLMNRRVCEFPFLARRVALTVIVACSAYLFHCRAIDRIERKIHSSTPGFPILA
jgi:hypothetical protein